MAILKLITAKELDAAREDLTLIPMDRYFFVYLDAGTHGKCNSELHNIPLGGTR